MDTLEGLDTLFSVESKASEIIREAEEAAAGRMEKARSEAALEENRAVSELRSLQDKETSSRREASAAAIGSELEEYASSLEAMPTDGSAFRRACVSILFRSE